MMDALTNEQERLQVLAEKGFIPPVSKGEGPRKAATYRAARRNHVKSHGMLPMWRQFTAAHANERAGLKARAVVANGAREAASKALVDSMLRDTGARRDVIVATAMLDHYRQQKRTRPVNRIIRELERQIRQAGGNNG